MIGANKSFKAVRETHFNEMKNVVADDLVCQKQKRNTQNGITLVALIITVITLLILATVSISLVINNNVLDHAQHGVDRYSEEEELEQIKLAVASAMLKGNGFLDTDNLNSELQEKFGEEADWIESSKRWNFKLDKNMLK